MDFEYAMWVADKLDIPDEHKEPICPFCTRMPLECHNAYHYHVCCGCEESVIAYVKEMVQ